MNYTRSPQEESYIHSYFIPGQNTKSSKCNLERKREKKKKKRKKQPTILDTTQSTANTTSISIYMSIIIYD